jgi:hypothetical protein
VFVICYLFIFHALSSSFLLFFCCCHRLQKSYQIGEVEMQLSLAQRQKQGGDDDSFGSSLGAELGAGAFDCGGGRVTSICFHLFIF